MHSFSLWNLLEFPSHPLNSNGPQVSDSALYDQLGSCSAQLPRRVCAWQSTVKCSGYIMKLQSWCQVTNLETWTTMCDRLFYPNEILFWISNFYCFIDVFLLHILFFAILTIFTCNGLHVHVLLVLLACLLCQTVDFTLDETVEVVAVGLTPAPYKGFAVVWCGVVEKTQNWHWTLAWLNWLEADSSTSFLIKVKRLKRQYFKEIKKNFLICVVVY